MNLPWKLGLGAVAVLFLTVALVRSCGVMEPIVIPDYQGMIDSLKRDAAVRDRFWRDSVTRERAVSDSAKRAADSWRRRSLANRPARPQPHAVATPDSNPTGLQPRPVPGSGTIAPNPGSPVTHTSADSIVWLTAQIDSLWAALDASDSAYASLESAYFAEQRRSAAALAGWAAADSALAVHDKLANLAITDLTARLRKAQRGCRVLFLPCPQVSAGYGATLANGQVRVGPTVGITVPVRF